MKKYFPALDGLRLFASLNIVLLHLDSSWLLSYTRQWDYFYPAIQSPLFSSSIFFLLGGFIYAVKFSDPSRIPPWSHFLAERLKRLYPLHLVCTLCMAGYVAYSTPLFHQLNFAWRSIAMHLSLLWPYWPQNSHSLNQPSWAISAFFLSYLFTPFLARYFNQCHTRKLWILFVASLLPGLLWGLFYAHSPFSDSRYLRFHIFPPIRMFEFFTGMLLAHLHLRGAIRVPRRAFTQDSSIFAALALLYGNIYLHKTPWESLNWISHHSFNTLLYAALLILLAQPHGRVVQALSWSPIRAIGKASFYPYLWHMPLIGLSYFVCQKLGCQSWTFNHWSGTLVLLIILYGGSTLFSQWTQKR